MKWVFDCVATLSSNGLNFDLKWLKVALESLIAAFGRQCSFNKHRRESGTFIAIFIALTLTVNPKKVVRDFNYFNVLR